MTWPLWCGCCASSRYHRRHGRTRRCGGIAQEPLTAIDSDIRAYAELCRSVPDLDRLAVGDPTVDLVAAWELLDPGARALFRTEACLDDHTWLLGRAWALALAVMTFPYYWRTMPERCAGRLAIARQVLMDADLG